MLLFFLLVSNGAEHSPFFEGMDMKQTKDLQLNGLKNEIAPEINISRSAILFMDAILPNGYMGAVKSTSQVEYSKYPHIRTSGLRTPRWKYANKAPYI